MNKIRVLIIDDSILIRKLLTEILNSSPDIEVVGVAADPLIAREMIKQLNPDVLTLDIEMPHMDGITFLKNLMRLRPTPVVMISTLTERGAEVTLEALTLGAVDFIAKPKVDVVSALNNYADEVIAKVKMAARANLSSINNRVLRSKDTDTSLVIKPKADIARKAITISHKLIAIGASTGGTEAIKFVVKDLPVDTYAVLIVQHLPAAFSESLVRHIDTVSQMTACIPIHGQVIEKGHIYLAPGDRHMTVIKEGFRYLIQLNDGELVNRHKPAVDVLFHSVAKQVGTHAVAVLLTGMGADGALGMKSMHEAGSKTIIQDEPSSVVWGMPGAAFKLGCTDHVLPLTEIAGKILMLTN